LRRFATGNPLALGIDQLHYEALKALGTGIEHQTRTCTRDCLVLSTVGYDVPEIIASSKPANLAHER
jgi:hypothetical protein